MYIVVQRGKRSQNYATRVRILKFHETSGAVENCETIDQPNPDSERPNETRKATNYVLMDELRVAYQLMTRFQQFSNVLRSLKVLL